MFSPRSSLYGRLAGKGECIFSRIQQAVLDSAIEPIMCSRIHAIMQQSSRCTGHVGLPPGRAVLTISRRHQQQRQPQPHTEADAVHGKTTVPPTTPCSHTNCAPWFAPGQPDPEGGPRNRSASRSTLPVRWAFARITWRLTPTPYTHALHTIAHTPSRYLSPRRSKVRNVTFLNILKKSNNFMSSARFRWAGAPREAGIGRAPRCLPPVHALPVSMRTGLGAHGGSYKEGTRLLLDIATHRDPSLSKHVRHAVSYREGRHVNTERHRVNT